MGIKEKSKHDLDYIVATIDSKLIGKEVWE